MSTYTVALLIACVSVTGVGLAAQRPDTPAKVLTGCLREGRADTATANVKGVIYTLEARREILPTSPAPEGSGPVEASGRYALSFAESVDLSKHVDHQVEVRGHVVPRPATQPSAAQAPAPKPLPGAAQQMFHVTEIKMLSATCK